MIYKLIEVSQVFTYEFDAVLYEIKVICRVYLK